MADSFGTVISKGAKVFIFGNSFLPFSLAMLQPKEGQESTALAQFMKITSDLDQDEVISLKFLRARDGNLGKAEAMLRKSVKWRTDNNIDQYLQWNPPERLAKEFQLTYTFTGLDNDGVPVIYLPFGNYKSKECIQMGLKEDIPKFTYHILENAAKIAENHHRSQVLFIIDCTNLSVSQVCHRESMQVLYGNFQALEMNYPEIIKHLIVINAPWIFSTVFKIIKPILSDYTMSKIQIYDSNKKIWMAELLKKIPRESIPNDCL